MSKAVLKEFERDFRTRKSYAHLDRIARLTLIKRSVLPPFYADLIKAFINVFPDTFNLYFRKGKQGFRDLLWGKLGDSTNLEGELVFATLVFTYLKKEINDYLSLQSRVEDLVYEGKLSEALELIEIFREMYGWSFWGIELQFKLLRLLEPNSNTRLKKLSEDLLRVSNDRLVSMFSHIFRERVDDAVSVDSFIDKCKNTFLIEDNRSENTYMFFRSLGTIYKDEKEYAEILSSEIVTSSVDYYDSYVDCLEHLSINHIHQYRDILRKLTNELLEIGISDFRLKKVYFLATETSLNKAINSDPVIHKNNLLRRITNSLNGKSSKYELEVSFPLFLQDIYRDLIKLKVVGFGAQEEIARLLKSGIGFRGLSIGNFLSAHAVALGADVAIGGDQPNLTQFSCADFDFKDYLYLQYDHKDFLVELIQKLNLLDSKNLNVESPLLQFLLNQKVNFDAIDYFNDEVKWLVKALIKSGDALKAIRLLKQFSASCEHERIDILNLQIWAEVVLNNLESAFELATNELIQNHLLSYELPLSEMVVSKRWSNLKEIDSVQIGIVSDATFAVTRDSNARYICRMACRKLWPEIRQTDFTKVVNSYHTVKKDQLVYFLKNVWVGDNLTLVGFESANEVRKNRIEVLSLLLQVDSTDDVDYAEEIKELTLLDTIWRGLRHINETRIFVNEAAITRWAEKELSHDFERWKQIRLSSHGEEAVNVNEAIKGFLLPLDKAVVANLGDFTENDAQLLNLIDRLLKRFLSDSADGLDSYLSSRIRHGSLKGTILGPLEEAGLIGVDDAEVLQILRIKHNIHELDDINEISKIIKKYSQNILAIINNLINEELQIYSSKKTKGRFHIVITKDFKQKTFLDLIENASFQMFVTSCYHIFWALLRPSLNKIAESLKTEIKQNIQLQLDHLIEHLGFYEGGTKTLRANLRAIATSTQAQCELVAKWFQSDKSVQNETYTLKEAFDIANAATKNVYRLFPIQKIKLNISDVAINLTSFGLTAITDSLYVMLENAWKHSGFGSEVGHVQVDVSCDLENNVLTIRVSNPITDGQLTYLKSGYFDTLKERISEDSLIENAPLEGGSGIPKLMRLVRMVSREKFPKPLSIEIQDSNWIVTVNIPVFPRGDAFDAYFE